jgi:RHS repeat-associated protein
LFTVQSHSLAVPNHLKQLHRVGVLALCITKLCQAQGVLVYSYNSNPLMPLQSNDGLCPDAAMVTATVIITLNALGSPIARSYSINGGGLSFPVATCVNGCADQSGRWIAGAIGGGSDFGQPPPGAVVNQTDSTGVGVDTVHLYETLAGACFYQSNTLGTWSSNPPIQARVPKTLGGPRIPQNLSNSPQVSVPRLDDNNCPRALCGNPIDAATGNKFQTEMDFVAGPNTQISFARYYNSQDATGLVGVGWHSTYHRGLAVAGSVAILTRADGRGDVFVSNNGTWTSDPDVTIDFGPIQSNGVQTGWIAKLDDDSMETYSMNGHLMSIATRSGLVTTLDYDSSGQLTTVTGPFGHSLTFAYDANRRLTQMTAPGGKTYAYAHDTNGNLTSVTYPDNSKRQYVYENSTYPNALTGVIDENAGRFASWNYDSAGRAVSSQHAGGADLTTVSYNDSDGSRVVTNALGQQHLYEFSTIFGVPKVVEIDRLSTATTSAATRRFTYDSNGFLASETDWNGNLTTYVNNSQGEPTNIVEASGTAQARSTTITYHASYHLPLTIVASSLTTTYAYDSDGNLISKALTDTTATIAPYSTKGTARTWTYTWTNSLLTSVKGPRTDVAELTSFTYDASAALTSVTNALNQRTQITQTTADGLPQTIVDSNGVTTNFAYDLRQRLLTSTLLTGAGALTTSLTYDAAGNLLKTTLPDGSALTNTYDAAHRLTAVTDLFGQSTIYTLDALGDRTQIKVTDSSAVVHRQHTATFDALARMLQDIAGVGQTTSLAYDANGNVLTVTDPLNRVTQQSYDALNHLTRTIDAASGITKATYDPHDRPATIVDPNSGSTTYVYDGFGDIIQRISPDTGKTIYTYDLAGNLIQRVDATGAVANYTYDALDRVLTTTYPADSTENVTYSYDQSGHGFGIGRLTSVTDAVGTLSRSHDERGNVLTEIRVHGAATLVISTNYDKASRAASITYPSGWIVTYARDAMGRTTATTAQAPGGGMPQPILSSITYAPFGPISGLSYGNDVAEARSFDLDYRMLHLTDTGTLSLQNLTYAYDLANNVSKITDGVNTANTQTLGYDVLDRLINATGNYGTLGYSYTKIGNRLTQTAGGVATNYAYAPHSNQLNSISAGTVTQTVGTTPAGNVTSFSPAFGAVTNLTYNQANRLATASSGSSLLTQYTYDAFGNRLVKTGAATATTLYQYDQSVHLLEEADGQGHAQVDYIYLGDRPVATIQPSNGKMYFLHDDRLGTPQMATDSIQAITWTATYQPFGQISVPGALIAQGLRFPGQENDQETELYHNGFRDYIPALGRYLESDPIGLASGVNTYSYVGGNPFEHVDSTGTSWTGAVYGSAVGAFYGGLSAKVSGGDEDAVKAAALAGAIFGFAAGFRSPNNQAALSLVGAVSGGGADYLGQLIAHASSEERDQVCSQLVINYGSIIGSAVGGAAISLSTREMEAGLLSMGFSASEIEALTVARTGVYSTIPSTVGSVLWSMPRAGNSGK